MPDWAITLLIGGASVLISLIITFIFNGLINLPKQRKQKKLEEAQKEKEFLIKINQAIEDSNKPLLQNQADISEELVALRKRDEAFDKDLKLLKKGLQATLKNELKTQYTSWIDQEYAPIDAKNDLEGMYQAYHNLGANGVMDSMRAEFMALPLTPTAQKKQKQNKSESNSKKGE